MNGATSGQPEPTDLLTRWWLVLAVAALFSAVFYAYEHQPEMYAGGARSGVSEAKLKDSFVDQQAAGSAVRRLSMLAFAGAGVLLGMRVRDRPWSVSTLGVAALVLLLLWSGFSATYSDNPGLSLRRLAAALLVVFGCVGFARVLRPHEIVSVALVSLTGLIALSLTIDVAAGGRPWAGGERFGGTLHANSQAMYCGLLCLAAVTQPVGFGSRWMTRSLLVAGLVAMVLTRSRTGLIAVVASLIITWVVTLSARVRLIGVAVVLSGAALMLVAVSSSSTGQRAQLRDAVLMGRTEQAGSLTGRVPLWEELMGYVAKRPLTGYGFEAFWTPRRMDLVMKSQGWALQSAHNAYLEVTLQIGLIGMALASVFVIVCTMRLQGAVELTRNPGYAFAIGAIFLALLDSLLQSHFNAVSYPTVLALTPMLSATLFYPGGAGVGSAVSRPSRRRPVALGSSAARITPRLARPSLSNDA
ncbi:MAG: O-antigen ligase family protein [Planctomycetota bacterium]